MRFLHAISIFLLLLGAGFFAFDIFCHLMNLVLDLLGVNVPPLVEGMMKEISIESSWTAVNKDSYEVVKSLSAGIVSPSVWDMFVHMPAPTVLIAISAIFYIPYKILWLMGLGRKEEPK